MLGYIKLVNMPNTKNRKLIFYIGTLILSLFVGLSVYLLFIKGENETSLSLHPQLKRMEGKIVFTRRDENGDKNIWKINADGTNEEILYHHSNEVNSNCSDPNWSKSGNKIFFTAMKEDAWKRYVMDADGTDVRVAENKKVSSFKSSESEDLKINAGSVLWQDDSGEWHEVYHHSYYDSKLNPGAISVFWGPKKENVTFVQAEKKKILIAGIQGHFLAELTRGTEPDWGYFNN